jgi:HD-like signal output (HDOD) protein
VDAVIPTAVGEPAAPNGTAEDERPEALRVFLSQITKRDDFPAFVRNVEQITEVVHDPKARVQLLNDAIAGDVALSLKVLRIANSAIYAAAGRTVETVYQAILLLGFERMKDIAVGAAVFEHLKHRTPLLQDLMATSVIAANTAVAISGHAGFGRTEVAYLCGIFRNLGELVVACYRPKEYAEYRAQPLAEDDPGATTERAHFGFRFDELGQALAELWGLPEQVSNAMCRPPSIGPGRADGPGTLAAITQLAADVTHAVYRAPDFERRARIKLAVSQYGKALGFTEDSLLEAARLGLDASEGALRSVRSDFDPARFALRLAEVAALVRGEEAPDPEAFLAQRGAAAGGQPASGDAPVSRPTPTAWVFGESAQDVLPEPSAQDMADAAVSLRGALTGARPLGTDEAIARTLAALLGIGFQRAALLLAADNHTRMRVRTAIGEGEEYLGERLALTLRPPSSALALAIVRREDVFGDLRGTSPYRSDTSIKRLRSASFVLLPVLVGGQVIGAIFADSVRRPLEFTPEVRAPILEMRAALCEGLERLRQLAPRPATA